MKKMILKREGKCFGKVWKQYLVCSNERVVIVEMTPAMFGWNIERTTVQGATDWEGMTASGIVAWKFANDDGLTTVADDINPEFETKILAL